MDDSMEDSVFDKYGDSDGYSPVPVVKKAASKKAAVPPKTAKAMIAKKMVQSTLKTTKVPAKKRAKPESDDDSDKDVSALSNTPPSAKKPKKAPVKKAAGVPLQDIANESVNYDEPVEIKPAGRKKTATEQYQKLTQLEHIIKRPDTYIGSVEMTEQQMWVFNSETSEMEWRKVNFVPGLYKIFDEILVNAADNRQRDPNMKNIKVTMDRETGQISVENDGAGIPVQIHEKERVYIPEMIFGHLLAGSNFDDEEAKTTGGRNGYGAKLCNIFSTEFTLETQDSNSGKRYKQTWTDNMANMGKAKITSSKSSDFTRVTFTPDYKRFKMNGIDDDFEALVKRRVYDMAGTLKGVKTSLNGTIIKLSFQSYIKMYAKAINKERGLEDVPSAEATVLVDDVKNHEKWEIGFAVSDGSFHQVSFVNSIATTFGGTHVNYISDQICEKLLAVVKKKNPKGAALKSNQIKNHIFLFVNCLIVNPAFTSQTKEQLTTKKQAFGSKCVLSEQFLKKIGETDAVQNILNFAQAKADSVLAKSDGNRRSRMSNPKLVDANLAGTKRGHECTLILTEGDSAKGLAVAGRAILDPDRIGVFPLRGKMLNVRDAGVEQIAKNAEIQNIKQFLGLKHKTVYKDTTSLRYGHLMIMADQDHDGSHIKGLLINFLQVQYPSLLKLPDFFREFITPIVKVWKGPNPRKPQNLRSFFTMPQYEEWKESHVQEKGWKHKYYKGLGTSEPGDAQVYFSNLDDHLREFESMKTEEEELFELAFSKKKADARKAWLGNFRPGTYLDHSTRTITYDNFVNKELILFSMADNLRSIPSVIDGFKPGQRKVLHACFKRNLVKDMKVVELAGYVSEHTAYHHGEASMHMTITGLAQNYVGSNNINCLEPSGNFGSRLAGGTDAASPRYIFTRLSPFARKVFSPLDEPLYEHNVDDGKKVEPTMFAPIIPMVLVNGADGIGTGWSTTIPNYHPIDIVNNLKRRMGRSDDSSEEAPFTTMMPWFKGWKGTVEEVQPGKYSMNGIVRETGDKEVEITELPIRVWTDDFKARLEDIIKAEKVPSFIKDYKEYNDHQNVHFIIQMDEKHMKAALHDGLAERFKLNKTIATTNLVAFDTNGQMRKYEKVEDILEEYYVYRLEMYSKRKAHWLGKLDTEFRKLKNQARFVMEIIDGKLVVSKKKKPVLVAELRKRNYEAFSRIKDAKDSGETEDVAENEDEADDDTDARDFDYLLGMPIWSLTQERVDKLKDQMAAKKDEHDELDRLSDKDLWVADLDAFVAEWELQLKEQADYEKSIRNTNRRASRKIGAGKSTKSKKNDDDYNPKPTKANIAKGVVKVENKPSQRFAQMFDIKPKPKSKPASFGLDGADDDDAMSGMSDDDFDALRTSKAKDATSKESSVAPSNGPTNGRGKRAAAAAPKKWVVDDEEDESDSDGGDFLGDIGDMVKGIGASGADDTLAVSGRVSLHQGRPTSSHGVSSDLPKVKAKPSKIFNISDDDETNYDMLAASSPRKAPQRDDLDSFISDEEPLPVKKLPAKQLARAPVVKSVAKKVTKPKAAKPAPVAKPVALSPAAKAYAAKQSKLNLSKDIFSNDEDEDMDDAPAPKAASRAKKFSALSDSEDDDMDDVPPAKAASKTTSRAKKSALSESEDEEMDDAPSVKSKPVAKPAAKAKAVPTTKKAAPKKKQSALSDDEEEDVDLGEEGSPPPRAAASGRGRPARAAVVAAKKPIYVDSEDEEEDTADFDESAVVEEDEESEEDYE